MELPSEIVRIAADRIVRLLRAKFDWGLQRFTTLIRQSILTHVSQIGAQPPIENPHLTNGVAVTAHQRHVAIDHNASGVMYQRLR